MYPPTEHHDLIVDLGMWLHYIDSVTAAPNVAPPPPKATAASPEPPASTQPSQDAIVSAGDAVCCASQLGKVIRSQAVRTHMAQVGVSLLVLAVDSACTHLAGTVMRGLAAVGHSQAWVLAECTRDSRADSLTLLQLAAGSAPLQALVSSWGWGEQGEPVSSSSGLGPPGQAGGVTEAALQAAGGDKQETTQPEACGGAVATWPESGGAAQWAGGQVVAGALGGSGVERGGLGGARLNSLGSAGSAQGIGRQSCMGSSKGPEGDRPQCSEALPTSVTAPFPYAAYHLWLHRQNVHLAGHFFTIITGIVVVINIRQFWLKGELHSAGSSLVFPVFHAISVTGSRSFPAWFERRAEEQNMVWNTLRLLVKLHGAMGGDFAVAPPLRYLGQADCVIEGLLATLAAQVRMMDDSNSPDLDRIHSLRHP